MIKFGKPFRNLFRHKQSFFASDEMHRAETERVAEHYRRQPKREECVCCTKKLVGVTFEKTQIKYTICSQCGHLNGAYQDTPDFVSAVYGGELVSAYFDNSDYDSRVKDIYLPKAEFVAEALTEAGERPEKLSYFDYGAGGGHFLSALEKTGVANSFGFEPSEGLRTKGNAVLGRKALLDSTDQAADADVVSFIHTLEHIPNFRSVLRDIINASSARYIFVAVPLFSPAVFFEIAFPDVFHRHLSCGHTHLFSENSLDYICSEFGLHRTAEWWFGADMMDFYRMVLHSQNKEMADLWTKMCVPVIDDMQASLDSRKLSSEVHFLARIER